jgi:hypothetical protein
MGLKAAALVVCLPIALALPASAGAEEFGFTGEEQTYTVPAGVSLIDVVARGAAGQGTTGGRGAEVSTLLDVSPGEVFYVEVGTTGSCNGAGPPGYAASGDVPAGGGASDLRTESVTTGGGSLCAEQMAASLNSRILVAAGGGGASSFDFNAGGDAGQPGDTGVFGGQAGSQTAAGAGGGGNGNSGGLGFGAPGTYCCPSWGGGGGGGGLYGGGSGGYSQAQEEAGGGGGGSSLVPAGGAFALTTAPPGVTITPDLPPVISGLVLTPPRFKPGAGDTPLERRAGTSIGLTLSEDASVRFRIRRDPPRPSTGRPAVHPKAFTRQLSEGANAVPFTGRLAGRAFKPGKYTLFAKATDARLQKSERLQAAFTIKR